MGSAVSSDLKVLPKTSSSEKWLAAAEFVVQLAIRAAFIAGQILIAVYFFPPAWHWIAIPLVAIEAAALSVFFFPRPIFTGQGGEIFPLITPVEYHPPHYPKGSPVGYWNKGLDCAINSTLHLLDTEPEVRQWMSLNDPVLGEFYRKNDDAVKNKRAVSSGSSAEVRQKLSKHIGISPTSDVQEDAGHIAAALLERLPPEMGIRYEASKVLAAEGGDIPISTQPVTANLIPLNIDPKDSSLERSLQMFYETATEGEFQGNPFNLERNAFQAAPPSLRFQLVRTKQDGTKVDTPVKVPEDLTITLEGGAKHSYRLAGVVSHHGNTIKGGHYTACQIRGKDKFLENDSQVTLVETPEDQKKWDDHLQKAYLVWYLPLEPLH